MTTKSVYVEVLCTLPNFLGLINAKNPEISTNITVINIKKQIFRCILKIFKHPQKIYLIFESTSNNYIT